MRINVQREWDPNAHHDGCAAEMFMSVIMMPQSHPENASAEGKGSQCLVNLNFTKDIVNVHVEDLGIVQSRDKQIAHMSSMGLFGDNLSKPHT